MEVSLLAIVVRVFAVYSVLLVLLRLTGRGTLGQARPVDLLTVLLLSETVGPSLTAGDDSLGAGLLAAAALCAAATATSWLSFRFRWFDRALDGSALVLIRAGHVDPEVMRSQRITDEALRTALHHHGVMSVRQVDRAFVEPDGSITMVTKEGR